MKCYRVMISDDIKDFESKVDQALKAGCELVGGVHVKETTDPQGRIEYLYFQAMVHNHVEEC